MLIDAAAQILLDGDLTDDERSSKRAKIQRQIARVALRHLGPQRAGAFLLSADRQISRRAREQGAQLPGPSTNAMPPEHRSAIIAALTPQCHAAAATLASHHGEDVQTRLSLALECAVSARLDLKPSARLFSFHRILADACPPDDIAEPFAAALANVLDVDFEAARAVEPSPRPLTAQIEAAKAQIRRDDHDAAQHSRPRHVARTVRPRARRSRRRPSSSRAGPSDDDSGPGHPARSWGPQHRSERLNTPRARGRARCPTRRPR